ncbi:MAG: hypothetical protein AUI10_08610 [Actinobacteria bacterium 13_2_20CM_2_72_6]|nr:MAG: hypothetical protein AUI10_08610 [Actinobacteria bacterium 13_2_20CM_2_72_6]
MRATTETSKVPAPKSCTTTTDPIGTQRHRVEWRTAGRPAGLLGDPDQHRREQVDDRQFALTEQHTLVVDAPLRVGLVPGRVQPRAVHRVPPDQQVAARFRVHRGRHERRTVDEQRPRPPVRPAQHRDRVRGPEVDPEREP